MLCEPFMTSLAHRKLRVGSTQKVGAADANRFDIETPGGGRETERPLTVTILPQGVQGYRARVTQEVH